MAVAEGRSSAVRRGGSSSRSGAPTPTTSAKSGTSLLLTTRAGADKGVAYCRPQTMVQLAPSVAPGAPACRVFVLAFDDPRAVVDVGEHHARTAEHVVPQETSSYTTRCSGFSRSRRSAHGCRRRRSAPASSLRRSQRRHRCGPSARCGCSSRCGRLTSTMAVGWMVVMRQSSGRGCARRARGAVDGGQQGQRLRGLRDRRFRVRSRRAGN